MKKHLSKSFKFAFFKTLPIFFSYIFLGIAFGILLQEAGYNFLWALAISILVYAGAFQFVLVALLSSGASILTAALTAIFINGRHLFYGLSFVDKFKKMGKKYPYMIHSLTDETFSLLCSCKFPDDIDEEKSMFYIGVLDHIYWITGCVLGALIGQVIPFDFTGIDFCMTALFVIIFINQWKSFNSHLPAIIGICSGIVFLILLGSDKFLLPSLITTVSLLMLCEGFVKEPQNKEAE